MNDRINFLKFFYESSKFAEDNLSAQIVDLFPAHVCVYDLESDKAVLVNRKFSSYFGYTVYELKESENLLHAIVHTEDWERFNAELTRFITLNEDETLEVCCRLTSRDGASDFFKILVSVLKRGTRGKAASLLLIAQDITEDVKSIGQAKMAKRMAGDTEELLNFGSWTLLVDQGLMEWSPGLSLMLGYGKAALIKTRRQFIRHMNESDRKVFELCLDKAIVDGSDFTVEYAVKTRTGEEKIFYTKGKIVLNSKGSLVRILGITSDVTELRKFQREQERAIRELNRSNQELEEFAYVASHDLQEPLRKISMFGERLQDKLKDTLDNESQVYLKRILSSADNMKGFIDHLLEFSRTSRKTAEFSKCDIQSVLVSVLSDLELTIEETGAHVEFDGELPIIEGVPSELTQLFSNLMSNAIKFRKTGQAPTIRISVNKLSEIEKSELELKPDRVFFKFDIADNGIGFEQEYAEKIFLIFQRLNGKSEYPGSGIGLAICKKIVDNHNGRIFANSEPGKGANFTVILPETQL